MKPKYIILAIGIAACSKTNDNSLAGKQAELTNLKTEQATLTSKIKTLEAAILKLDTTQASEQKVKSVVVSPITAQKFNHYVEVQGTLDAVNNVLVGPQTGGAITKVYVKEGDYVKQGQLIAKIDNSILSQSMQEIKVQLDMANTIYERQKALWEQKIGTEMQYIQAQSNVESIQKRLATAEKQAGQAAVRSPLAGYVDEVRLKSGEIVSPGMGIVRVINLNNLKVVARIADTYAGTIKKGDLVQIRFPDLNKSLAAHLTFVSQSVNNATRTFTVEAQIPNISQQLKPNMTAIVNINDQSKASAIVVDQNIIQNTDEGPVVYVAVKESNKKIVRSRKVKTGLTHNGNIEILDGLKIGDELITQGYQDIADGQVVSY